MTTTSEAVRTWANWTEPEWVDVDGVRVGYRRKGSGPVLLYLHGAGLTRQWLPLYEELARSFDVVVPEHPGFGDTALPSHIRTFDDLVLHYDALVRDLGLDGEIHLVGHSMGGWLAADLAVTYPTRFATLTLMAPMGLRAPHSTPADPFRWSPEQADHHVFSGVAEKYLDFLVQEGGVEDYIHEYGESIPFARLTWNPRYDVRLEHRLARVQAPTRVIHFADDNFIPRELSARYAELVPGAGLVVLDGAGGEPASHVSIVQQPAAIAALIAEHAASPGR
ncbi:alpha/beta hydrolase [Actinomadura graeca]|uniref:Alpha/beta hydrolase n=1 Tax=Actinomadura graeca TaxID=2750812 RepID=A0ABX8QT44_9ACTN|nr:alpha/beta hydrolase [Actinomadura graeca]QXJ21129.1 alpha/beta hydrolase [Actinomadura graeca]